MSLKNTHEPSVLKDTNDYRRIKKSLKITSRRRSRHIAKAKLTNTGKES